MRSLLATVALAALLAGCEHVSLRADIEGESRGGDQRSIELEREGPWTVHRRLDIPPGHLPPPGECRIWFPGEPPGQQPPPGPCYDLVRDIPPGAWLISRPARQPQYVRVAEYDPRRPQLARAVRIYDAESLELVSAMEP